MQSFDSNFAAAVKAWLESATNTQAAIGSLESIIEENERVFAQAEARRAAAQVAADEARAAEGRAYTVMSEFRGKILSGAFNDVVAEVVQSAPAVVVVASDSEAAQDAGQAAGPVVIVPDTAPTPDPVGDGAQPESS